MPAQQILDLLDQAEHCLDAARHCMVEIAPDQFVITRTRAQADRLRALLVELRTPEPESTPEPPAAPPVKPPAKRAARAASATDA